jgi:hypothetical protein
MTLVFQPLTVTPLLLLCYKAEPAYGLEAPLQFLFDSSVGSCLDYEGASYPAERIRELPAG